MDSFEYSQETDKPNEQGGEECFDGELSWISICVSFAIVIFEPDNVDLEELLSACRLGHVALVHEVNLVFGPRQRLRECFNEVYNTPRYDHIVIKDNYVC